MISLFNLAMILVVPFWLLMVLLPGWRWTKRIIGSPWVALGPAVIYAWVVVPRLPEVLVVFNPPTVDSLSTFLSSPEGVVITWAHFLAFDLLIGRWIYMDSRAVDISAWIIAPVLLLAFMLAPLGWLLYMLVRIPAADDPLHTPVENRLAADAPTATTSTAFRTIRHLWRRGMAYWRETSAAQRTLFVTGTGLFLWMLAHIGLLIVGNRPFDGPTSYRKAATFAETGWLMCWAVAYALPYLNIGKATRWSIIGGTLLFGAGETVLMSMQVWRGVPSHYNFTTIFNSVLFGTTGVIAALWLASMVVFLIALLRNTNFAPPMRLAYVTGTVLMIFGGVTGILMILNLSGAYQGNLFANIQTVVRGDMIGEFTGDVRTSAGGNLVVLHAFGVHGLSAIPLVAWLLGYATLPEQTRTAITGLSAAAYIGLTALLTAAAARTVPLSEIGWPLWTAIGAAGVVLAAVYGFAAVRGIPELIQADYSRQKPATAAV